MQRALPSWLWLCESLKIDTRGETNLSAVNWDGTFLFTNHLIMGRPLECAVELASGANFCAIQDVAVSYVSRDPYFFGNWPSRTAEQLRPFQGRINLNWQSLAAEFERALVERVRIPKKYLDPYKPYPVFAGERELGIVTVKRVLVRWGSSRKNAYYEAFNAEFDLETGELKQLAFLDRELISALPSPASLGK